VEYHEGGTVLFLLCIGGPSGSSAAPLGCALEAALTPSRPTLLGNPFVFGAPGSTGVRYSCQHGLPRWVRPIWTGLHSRGVLDYLLYISPRVSARRLDP
jgi:hypothetical protein